ncbi:MAG: aminotransferase class V-fold PLP-dependent enzyme [Polyangiaceae bacterium]|nr:aminotransferase class V-fold PLP-dependent enzyme [Polyangiaceae bacterium]
MNEIKIARRRVLEGLLAASAVGCSTSNATPTPAADPSRPPADEWAAVRAEFDLSPAWIHMTGFLLVSHPRSVRESIEQWRRKLDEDPVHTLEEARKNPPPVQEAAAAYMGVRPGEIALTDSTTMGLGTLYVGLPLAAGDEVLTSTHDHFSTHASLLYATERTGAKLRKVPMYDRSFDASEQGMVNAIAKAISPATKVVAITWVHSSTGVKTPVRGIAEAVAKANAGRASKDRVIVCVDGVHGFGIDDVTMADLGCDFFVAGCHKWLFGPRGTGVIWGKADLWPLLRPTIPPFGHEMHGWWIDGAAVPPTNANIMTPGGFHSFEHRWALPAAFELHQRIGKAKVSARIHALNRQCKEGLKKMKHVTLHTPMDDAISAGIICFEVTGMPPGKVVERLREKKVIASTSPYATTYARVAPSLLTSEADVEATLAAIRGLA